ncbi:hypothetical protein HK096_003694, partial [Nowakowskiella sp. JEL0078]
MQSICLGFVASFILDFDNLQYETDLTTETLPKDVAPGSVDVCLCIFVLSALHPESWARAVSNLEKVREINFMKCNFILYPILMILFGYLDYGRYDLAQLRFKGGRILDENLYVRGDGTRAYFFTQDEISKMFKNFTIEQNAVDRRLIVNRA